MLVVVGFFLVFFDKKPKISAIAKKPNKFQSQRTIVITQETSRTEMPQRKQCPSLNS
jgi:hypothetical protein